MKSCTYLLAALTAAVFVSCENGIGSSFGPSMVGVQSVTVSESSASLTPGETLQLTSAVSPPHAGNPAVQWVSSRTAVATVSGAGLVKAISPGTAVISAVSLDDPQKKADCTVTVAPLPDFTKAAGASAADYSTPRGVTFKAILSPDVPASSKFPFGRRFINGGYKPASYIAVPSRFMIAETETTWALWKEVYDWATDTERGDKVYSFADTGRMGGDSGAGLVLTPNHPVTSVNWVDAMVWCNALTEYFNAKNGTAADLDCVYTCNGAVIRSSKNDAVCITAVQNTSAKGFRLLTTVEWEFAARYIGPTDPADPPDPADPNRNYLFKDGYYYQINGSSGVIAWHGDFYTVTGVTSTAEVKSKLPNSLGIYDMSGNVAEWCFDPESTTSNPKARVLRGGGFRFTTDDTHEVGYEFADYSYVVDSSYGFRLAKNPD